MQTELLIWHEPAHVIAVEILDHRDQEVTNIFGGDVHVAEEVVLELRHCLQHLEDSGLADTHLALH